MSGSNGVIRVGRKGRKKFAFGEQGEPFEVDVVVAFQEWVCEDDRFREQFESREIPTSQMPAYNQMAAEYVTRLSGGQAITTAEALDFIARLRECYDEVAAFFRPKLLDEQPSPASSEAELVFSREAAAN